jgi:transcriptional regulator of acetoin/glycerol metabolism
MSQRETLKDLDEATGMGTGGAAPPVPGLVAVWSGDQPLSIAFRLDSAGLVVGRALASPLASDDRLSRHHARVAFEAERFVVTDLDSRNGTFVDGVRVAGTRRAEPGSVVRMGQSLFLCLADVGPVEAQPVRAVAEGVVGPRLGRAFQRIEVAARTSDTLLILGESGTGKELAARRFHAASPRASGPFVAVNCATIPEGIAERLLFGARRGAFSGATTNTEGHLQAADGGTLFLDELGELDPAVQPKMLRVLETREVIALGDSRGRAVDLGICAATLRDIPERVASGRFREDLYYRLGRPAVRLPPLRERREEIPFLIEHALRLVGAGPRLVADSLLVEACLIRPWPGNVRELLGEARRAGHAAREARRQRVERLDLGTSAGLHLAAPAPPPAAPAPAAEAFPARAQIEEALLRAQGNVTRAAQDLGVHRNQLRRWLARNEIDPRALPAAPGPGRPASRH